MTGLWLLLAVLAAVAYIAVGAFFGMAYLLDYVASTGNQDHLFGKAVLSPAFWPLVLTWDSLKKKRRERSS